MRRSHVWTSTIVFALTFGGACKGDDKKASAPAGKSEGGKTEGGGTKNAASKPSGGCDYSAKDSYCGEYYGNLATEAWVKEQCTAGGVPFVASCPTDKAVLRCVFNAGSAQEVHSVWYPPTTADQAKQMCEGGSGTVRTP